MKSIAATCLLALALAAPATASEKDLTSSSAGQMKAVPSTSGPAVSDKDIEAIGSMLEKKFTDQSRPEEAAVVEIEIFLDEGRRSTLVTSATISTTVNDAADPSTPEEKVDFTKPLAGSTPVKITREQTYVAQRWERTSNVKVGNKIKKVVKVYIKPGVIYSGVNARVRLHRADNGSIAGVLAMELRDSKVVSFSDADGRSIELPQSNLRTMLLPIKKGMSKQKMGDYTIKVDVKKIAP